MLLQTCCRSVVDTLIHTHLLVIAIVIVNCLLTEELLPINIAHLPHLSMHYHHSVLIAIVILLSCQMHRIKSLFSHLLLVSSDVFWDLDIGEQETFPSIALRL